MSLSAESPTTRGAFAHPDQLYQLYELVDLLDLTAPLEDLEKISAHLKDI
jgi:hypothetical protein